MSHFVNPYTVIDQTPPPAPYHLLPANLGALADVCERERGRFALTGVSLSIRGDTYRAEATDGKTLVRVEGTSDSPHHFPALPALLSAPNGETVGLIPARDWKEVFRSVPKRPDNPALRNVAVVLGKEQVTLATTGLDSQRVTSPRLLDGRYPDTDSVLPRALGGKGKGTSVATVRVDAKRLADLLKVALAFTGGDDTHPVSLSFYADGAPLTLVAGGAAQRMVALLMPLT